PWDGAGRVTILLMGLDYRDWETQKDYPRSDTMILLSMDVGSRTAGILSIPRDMWVPIPGFKHGKINTAYYLGEAYKLPGGGPALATKTVEQFLGVPINYYAQIDFGAFERFIDEIGGVEINVPERITIDLLGGEGVKTKKTLQPGRQALPGAWALAYARARYTEGGDFDRAGRQQQVIMGIRERMLTADMLPTMIQKAPTLYQELASGINTNLELNDVIRLALAAREIPDGNIQRDTLGEDSVVFGFSPDNLSILIPIPDKISRIRDQIFTLAGSLKPATPGDARQRMQAESARIAVYNGTQDGSLAERSAEFLTGEGAQVVEIGQADQVYVSTTIIDYSGSPFTLQYLASLIDNPYIRIISQYTPGSNVDVEIFLGRDWATNNPLP
ncbi:MAG: LCP family protein, partial [Anaerolineales bacterium]|nr:LCP family protein [Anaerolineales bacterium]